MQHIYAIVAILLAVITLHSSNAAAFTGILKGGWKIGAEAIEELATLGRSKGSQAVTLELEAAAKSLSGSAKTRFMQENLSRVLVAQNKMTKVEAGKLLRNLGSVPGFEKALSKMVGMSVEKQIGHGFELKTANALVKKGFKVEEIDKRFNDGIKGEATDIDLGCV